MAGGRGAWALAALALCCALQGAAASGSSSGGRVVPATNGNGTCTLPPSFDVQTTSTEMFLDIAVIMLVCRFMGLFFRAIGQPTVIGEIIAGILLGPSGLGQPNPCPSGSSSGGAPCDLANPTLLLFPTHTPFDYGPSNIRNYLNVLAQLGVVVFMFVVGLEVDVPKLKKTSGKAGIIALVSVAMPFCLGTFTLAPHLFKSHSTVSGTPVQQLSFNLFVGTCMSVTAFPVLARIITEKGLQKLQLGAMTLACAALNDVVAWALLAVVLAVQKSQSASSASGSATAIEYKPVLIELALIIVVVVGQFLFVQPLMRVSVFNHYKRTGSLSPNRLAWVLIGMFLSAWLVHHIGFHAMLGSFTFGLVFPRGYGTPFLYTILSKVEPFATLVLLPLFFMVTGLSIDLSQLNRSGMDLLYVLLVASGGKFIGSGVMAKLCGLGWRHSVAIGVMMNTRGLTEIVVLNIAKQAKIIDDEVFTMLVLMAVITTAMAGPLLSIIFTPRQLVKERAADFAASAAARVKKAGGGAGRGSAQLVVLVHDTARGAKLLSAAVSTLAPNMRAFLDVAQFSPPGELHTQTEMGTGLLRSPEEVEARTTLKEQLATVSRRGLSSSVTVRTTEDPVADALVHIRARDPQLVVTDWPAHDDERARLKELVVASPCTVVLWGGYSPQASMGGPAPPPPPPPTAIGVPLDVAAALEAGNGHANGKGHGNGKADPVAASVVTADAAPAAAPPAPRAPPKPRVTLRELLRSEAAQDEFVDDLMVRLWRGADHAKAALVARLPAFLQADADAGAGREEEDDDADEHGGDAHGGGDTRPRVKSDDKTVVTPQTMAVAAASSLSPKFSKLMVTGWPENDRECAELVKFLHDVEHEVVAKRMSLERRSEVRQGSYTGGNEPMPAIIEDESAEVQIVIPPSSGGVLLRPAPGLPRVASEENLESVTTVGPMLSQMLGKALQQQRAAG